MPPPPRPEPEPTPIPTPSPLPVPVPVPQPGPNPISPTVAAYLERRDQLVTVASARHVGLLPALMAREYRGVWLGFLIFLGLMVLVWLR